MPTVSVIVPVYKVEKYIHRCVDSILGQTFRDFELILVDDGSPDNCGAICDAYAAKDSRVVVIHQENGGLSAARNAGIDWAFAHSDSRWFSFVDSDDWVHPEYLQHLLDAAVQNNVSVSICAYAQTDGREPVIDPDTLVSALWDTEEFYVAHNVNATIAWGKLYRKECFETIRYPLGKLHEDEFTTYKILFRLSAVAVVAAPLYFYYTNPTGITKSGTTRFRTDAFDAIEEQIVYFRREGFDAAERVQICLYICKVYDKLAWFKKHPNSNNEYQAWVGKKRWKILLEYVPRLNPADDRDGWVLTRTYPKTMWVYWRVRAVLRKLGFIK